MAKEHLARFRPPRRSAVHWARPRRRRPSSGPRGAQTPTAALPVDGPVRPRWSTSTTLHGIDRDFGPFSLKFSSYFPYTARLCVNGHEYLKCQFRARGDPVQAVGQRHRECAGGRQALQAICDALEPDRDRRPGSGSGSRSCLNPYSEADRPAGYRYQVSILQAEFSLTQVFEQPGDRTGVLRGGDPREPRPRPTRPGPA